MSWTLIANTIATGKTGPTTSAIDTSTTPADLLILFVSQYAGASGGIVTVSDSQANTWSAVGTAISGSASYAQIYYCEPGTKISTSHTFSAVGNGANVFCSLSVYAFSGSAASPLDQVNGADTLHSLTVQPGSITPSVAGALVVTGITSSDNTTTFSISDPNYTYTIKDTYQWHQTIDSTEAQGLADAYAVQTTAGATNPTWTLGGTATYDQAVVIASFKPASGAGTSALTAAGTSSASWGGASNDESTLSVSGTSTASFAPYSESAISAVGSSSASFVGSSDVLGTVSALGDSSMIVVGEASALAAMAAAASSSALWDQLGSATLSAVGSSSALWDGLEDAISTWLATGDSSFIAKAYGANVVDWLIIARRRGIR